MFSHFAGKVRDKMDGFTLCDVISKASIRQKNLHMLVSIVILCCSTCVQFLGINTLLYYWFSADKLTSAMLTSFLALAMVGKDGIKGSIISDFYKYVIMVVGGIILLTITGIKEQHTPIFIRDTATNTYDMLITFGIPTVIGLMCAPYVDQTFWQRTFSIDKEKVRGIFIKSALAFAVVPFLFGMIGFMQLSGGEFEITKYFSSGISMPLFAICVLCALVSTLDSNLCAISSIACTEYKKTMAVGRASMITLLITSTLIMVYTSLSIVDLFLIYGTIRTCVALPTILIIMDKYNSKRLFIATLVTAIIFPVCFILMPEYKGYFTILAFITPMIGYENRGARYEYLK